jgi:putative SOS response-associated peptidase YedK
MPRRTRRSGRLIQKKNKVKTPVKTFRVLAEKETDFWLEAEFNLFEQAKAFIDKIPDNDINYYIHSENNRVLYTREGI